MLRLVSSTVGPASIAVGANGPTQTVEAYNAGDGSLSLTVTSSVTWTSATVGAPRPCASTTLATTCIPITVALSTSSLAAGTQTGILTVTGAANTVDAPQTITVTAAMGGSIPSSITAYVPPNGSTVVAIPTNSDLRYNATTQDGNKWLALTISGSGSFKFVYPWYVSIQAQAANTPGIYTGSVAITPIGASTFAGDAKTVAVTMNVTTQPIAQGPSQINLRLAQGAPPLSPPYTAVPLTITNAGLGTLTVSAVTSVVNSCGSSWLTVTKTASGASLTVDPTGLPAGTCSATLTAATNAANTLAPIPVTLQVVPKAPPLINYQGVLDNATFIPGDTVSQGDVMVVKGEQLSFAGATTGGYTSGTAPPLATVVGGASVLVNGAAAPIFYTLYGQIAFQMPVETPVGTVLVQVQRDDGSIGNQVSVQVAARAPKLLLVGLGTYGAITNAADGSFPFPVGAFPGLTTHPAQVGDTLVMYAIGLGVTSPSVATGQPAPGSPPLASVVDTATVAFGTGSAIIAPIPATPIFAGLTPTYAGLYQINVTIPPGCPTGTVDVLVGFPDGTVSNVVQIAVQ